MAGIPALLVVFILWKWSAGAGHSLYALARMLGQLLMIGYLLVYIFETDLPWIVLLALSVMVIAASWIALRTIARFRGMLYGYAFLSILVGGGFTVVLITQAVLTLDPWYEPSFVIPLAGMIFAGSMNAVSLAAERMFAEVDRGVQYVEARRIAIRAGLIPIVNSLLAVGLVSLPGLMTGQILSGVSPLVAVRYQVMVMCMIFGASGMSAALFLWLLKPSCLSTVGRSLATTRVRYSGSPRYMTPTNGVSHHCVESKKFPAPVKEYFMPMST